MRLLDAERAFQQSELTPHSLLGEELFLDHAHMNFEGNYLLAITMLREIEDVIPARIRRHASGLVPTEEQIADELVLTGVDRWWIAAAVFGIMQRQPFTGQLDH